MSIFMFFACNPPVDIMEGKFVYTQTSSFMESDTGEFGVDESLNGLSITIDSLSYTITFDEETIDSGELVLRDEDDWAIGCPTNFSGDQLMTYNMNPFSIQDISYEIPVLNPSCNVGSTIILSDYGNGMGSSDGCFHGVCLVFELE